MRRDVPDPVYDGPDARWPEVPRWRTWLALTLAVLALAGIVLLTICGAL